MKLRTVVFVSVYYKGLPVMELDRAITREAHLFGGSPIGSGFAFGGKERDLEFKFSRSSVVEKFVTAAERIAKGYRQHRDVKFVPKGK
jgi:hypothetical protein